MPSASPALHARPVHLLDEPTRAALLALVAAAAERGDALDDHLAADLAHGPSAGFTAVLVEDGAGTPLGSAHASAGNHGLVIGVVAATDAALRPDVHRAGLTALLAALPPDIPLTWWPAVADEPLAARLGLAPHRRLLRMEVPLPLEATTDVPTRPFRVGEDEAAWLVVNNAAFHWHGEQGGWDLDTLRRREQEPWFDPEAFLLHERDGRLAAFCWTKRHDDDVAEVYVVAVHPDFHGLGLGRALTVAGFAHQCAHGARTGMLYVDDTNTAAVRLYESLGMRATAARQSYHREPGGNG